MTKTKIVLLAIAILVVGFVAGAAFASRYLSSEGTVGAIVNDVSYLVGDVYQGSLQTLEFRNGKFVGPASSTQPAAFGTLSVDGGNPLLAMTTGTSTIATTTLGAFPNTTSTATTSVTLNQGTASGWVVGDGCLVTLTGVPTSSAFSAYGTIGAVATTTATVTISMQNLSTSAVTIASGTFKKARCFK